MKERLKEINKKRKRRKKRVRAKIKGTKDRPRLSVFKSNRYIYAQLIDDNKGETICSYSSFSFKKDKVEKRTKTQEAEIVGRELAKIAKSKGIKKTVFDRGGYKYHGRVKSLFESFNKYL